MKLQFKSYEGMSPLQLFPEEVWERILNNLADYSQDAWNLFKAFPQLDSSKHLQKRKHKWYFGKILPHLFPWNFTKWMEEQDLLNCRLVCYTWSSHVDAFLESLPKERSHHPRFQTLAEFPWKWMYTEEDDDDDSDSDPNDNKDYSLEAVPFGGTQFDCSNLKKGETKLSRFLKIMKSHPSGRSPFLGRSLSMICPRGYSHANEKSKNFEKDAIKLHKKFGKEVRFYHIDFCWERGCLSPTQLIPSCLSRLPNLKRLNVNLYGDTLTKTRDLDDYYEFLEEIEEATLPLPKLESLGIQTCYEELGHFLITRFSTQLRRLEMGAWLWKREYSQMFPRLKELQVTVGNLSDVKCLKGMLLNLEAPKLTKLQLLTFSGRLHGEDQRAKYCPHFVFERDVFQWLKRFPKLEYLNFGDKIPVGQVKERGTLSPDRDLVKSLNFLSVRTEPGMDYNFLRCLPSLQHLQLFVTSKVTQRDKFAVVHHPKLWLQLPKLREVTLNVESSPGKISRSWSFHREEYEYDQPLYNDFAPRRSKSILKFIRKEEQKIMRFARLSDSSSEAKLFLTRLLPDRKKGPEVVELDFESDEISEEEQETDSEDSEESE